MLLPACEKLNGRAIPIGMNSDATFPLNLTVPRYTSSEAIAVTGLKPETLQTWTNRGVIKLAEQNPGRGRRRLWSASVIAAKLAPMRRLDELKIALSVSTEIVEEAARILEQNGAIDWDLYIFLRAPSSSHPMEIVSSPVLAKYSPTVGDPRNMRVSDYVEAFEGILSRRVQHNLIALNAMSEDERERAAERRIDPARREQLARQGIHAEPVIIFPLGEIVNGALAQLRALEESEDRT